MDTRIVSTIPRVQKRKFCDANSGSDVEDEQSKVQKVECKDQTKKQNHSEIEKRRRDKMNTYITELSSMVPMCNAMSRKLDKLTVLRMAVQHMKTLRGSINSYAEGHYKPSFLSDEELKHLILQTAEGFLFVVSCDRGRILFVSESVSHILNYSQSDLLGQSWFDILHPKDIPKVKEQLSSSDLTSKERLVDAKAMLPLKNDVPQSQIRLCPGARRSFFCRMKCKAIASVKEEADTTTGIHKKRKSADRRYCVIHCTGYLKSWAPANLSIDEENEGDSDCNLSCLVAIGQVQQELINPALPQNGIELRHMEFTSRHAADGKFLFVDQRSTLILGYLPQELLGTSCYEYFHQDDIMTLAVSHRQVLQVTETVITQVYRFRTKEGNFTRLRSKWKNFRNPWTKEFECIVSVNTLIPVSDFGIVESTNAATEVMMNSNSSSLDTVLSFLPSTGNVGDSQRFFGSRVGAGKIGRQIAEEVMMEVQKAQSISPTCNPVVIGDLSTAFPGHSTILSLKQQDRSKPLPPTQNYNAQMDSSVENGEFHDHILQSDDNCIQYDHIDPNNPNINNSDMELMDTYVGREMLHASYHNSSNEGNDEAAMAVIMSLLEADAGLGGPVDFTGLPWPLP